MPVYEARAQLQRAEMVTVLQRAEIQGLAVVMIMPLSHGMSRVVFALSHAILTNFV